MYVGESERAARHCFEMARKAAPCVIFFEIDILCPSRSRNTELLTEIDGVESTKSIFILGATNKLDKRNSAMLNSRRFEHVVRIGFYSPEDRIDILKTITKAALKVYQPSATQKGFTTIPNITWNDIGALKEVKEELQTAILLPIKYGDVCNKHHMTSVSGVLLCGPEGCGKTLLAKVVANECSINFLSIKGPELLNMHVGESERAVRRCFERARNALCVVFFEIDALCPSRCHKPENAVADGVVTQFLSEIDGVESMKSIFILGATRRPDKIDSSMLRPGRFVHIDLPSPVDRIDILKRITIGKEVFQRNGF